jgi:hypothetical protein
MKTFKDIALKMQAKQTEVTNESPVGYVGRTGKAEAEAHVTPELEKRFKDIIKEMGGKTVAKELMSRMDCKGTETDISESTEQTPMSYLRDSGYKIKSENPTKQGFEIEFYKNKDAESAKEDLESAGFAEKYSFNAAGKYLEYTEL